MISHVVKMVCVAHERPVICPYHSISFNNSLTKGEGGFAFCNKNMKEDKDSQLATSRCVLDFQIPSSHFFIPFPLSRNS